MYSFTQEYIGLTFATETQRYTYMYRDASLLDFSTAANAAANLRF